MSNYMLRVRDEIARLPGAADFWTLGDRQYAMRIWIDPDKAAAYNISPNEFFGALQRPECVVIGRQPQPTARRHQRRPIRSTSRHSAVLAHPNEFRDIIVEIGQPGPHHCASVT